MTSRPTRRMALAGVAGLVLALPAPASAAPTETRVVGGRPAAEGAYPWTAYLGGCGGSLVSPDIIMSAAHCFGSNSTRVTAYVGKVRKGEGTRRTGSSLRRGVPADNDEDQRPPDNVSDWAVIKLDQPITDIAPVAVPADDRFDSTPVFRAMGWGRTSENGPTSSTLLEVDVPFVPDDQCARSVGKAEICAGYLKEGGRDTCYGDSGGPLAARDGDRWVLVGLTSWGKGCARAGEPGHYAQVSAFIPDMKAAIRTLGGTLPAGW
ncbi:trypsin [Pilimelia terevasa]|uniref:Trypsin n=1 Tax=Pilimelia terevasa TaxID=53372 RepID=A0A8J3BNH5_9ACTN|nr:serine protease [Pilimelia terevasa]GGK34042.1 trypsin [Pilimelia terevasa]